MSVPHFGGFVIAVSPLQAFTRLHEDWCSSQNPLSNPQMKQITKINKYLKCQDFGHFFFFGHDVFTLNKSYFGCELQMLFI